MDKEQWSGNNKDNDDANDTLIYLPCITLSSRPEKEKSGFHGGAAAVDAAQEGALPRVQLYVSKLDDK